MLQGLCKKLRMFGVDAVALGKTSSPFSSVLWMAYLLWHLVHVDPDPIFHFDADLDLDSDPDPDSIASFTHAYLTWF
jgi:hypothetical protein